MQSFLGGQGRSQNVSGQKARLLGSYLTYYDTVFLVEDSSTVKQTEWKEIQDTLVGFTEEAAKFDEHNLCVQFFNDQTKLKNIKNVQDVKNAFSKIRPSGTANISRKLKEIIEERNSISSSNQRVNQKALYEIKPLSIVVLTSGQFSENPHDIIQQIRPALQATREMRMPQDINRRISIQFVQVCQGDTAQDTLNQLENALSGEEDMIDVVRWNKGLNTETLYKVLLGSIYDNMDRQSGGQQAGSVSAKPPGLHDTHKPTEGVNCTGGEYNLPIARHEYVIKVPAHHKATVTAQSNAGLPQRVNLFLNPHRDGFPVFFEGKGEKQPMNVPKVGTKVRLDASSTDTWMILCSEYGLPCGRMTKWVAAPNKLVSQNGQNYVIGSDDGGFNMNPDGDYNDTLVTVSLQRE